MYVYKRSVKLALNGFGGGTKLYPRLVFGRSLPFVGEFHTCSVRIGNLGTSTSILSTQLGDTFRFLVRAEMGWHSSFLRCSYDDNVFFWGKGGVSTLPSSTFMCFGHCYWIRFSCCLLPSD